MDAVPEVKRGLQRVIASAVLLCVFLASAAPAFAWTDDPLAEKWHYLGQGSWTGAGLPVVNGAFSHYIPGSQLWEHFDWTRGVAHGVGGVSFGGTNDQYGGYQNPASGAPGYTYLSWFGAVGPSADSTTYVRFTVGSLVLLLATGCAYAWGNDQGSFNDPRVGGLKLWNDNYAELLVGRKNVNGSWTWKESRGVAGPWYTFNTPSSEVPPATLGLVQARWQQAPWYCGNVDRVATHSGSGGSVLDLYSGETTYPVICNDVWDHAVLPWIGSVPTSTVDASAPLSPWSGGGVDTTGTVFPGGAPSWLPTGFWDWLNGIKSWLASIIEGMVSSMRGLFYFLGGA